MSVWFGGVPDDDTDGDGIAVATTEIGIGLVEDGENIFLFFWQLGVWFSCMVAIYSVLAPFAAEIKVRTAANHRKRPQIFSDRGVVCLVAATSRPLASLDRCTGLWGVCGISFS